MAMVCVTGADRGLGLALTRKLLELGYTVFAGRFDSSWIGLDELAESYMERLILLELNIADGESVRAAASKIAEHTDQLDFVVNNGAILGDIEAAITSELDYEQMLHVYNVNALGTLRVTQALLPLVMKGEKKLIVNISSEAGSVGECSWRTSWYAYGMSKAALNMQSAIVHNTIKGDGGQVLVLHPGWVKTYMEGHFNETAELTAEEAAAIILKRIDEQDQYRGEQPAYLGPDGQRLSW
jgi:NAD(P)-dependent dehydrogenase (short-subunit alcohol dehydrogenase family)